MSNYSKLLGQFTKIGHSQSSRFNEYQINDAMDKICQSNLSLNEFDREIAQELFEHTEKDSAGVVQLRNYLNTILTAQNILQDNIRKSQGQLAYVQDKDERRDIHQNLVQFSEDYKQLTQPFNIKSAPDSRYLEESRKEVQAQRVRGQSGNVSGIFDDMPSNREESFSLKLTLLVALLAFLFEMVLMFQKDHFLSLLAYIAVLAIFFLNYFDKHYVKVCLGLLGLSCALDFIWIFTESGAFWDTNNPPTQHSTLQTGFLRFIFVMTIILMFVKLFIIILLFRYRNNDENMKKMVKIANLRFDLDGRITTNPLSLLLTGRQPKP